MIADRLQEPRATCVGSSPTVVKAGCALAARAMLRRVTVRQPALSGPGSPFSAGESPSMLRSRLYPTASPSEALVLAEGYKFLSATAVPGRSRLRPSLATCSGPDGVFGLRPASTGSPLLPLPQVPPRWAEPTGETLRRETPSDIAFGTAVLRVPRCRSGGFVQLGSM